MERQVIAGLQELKLLGDLRGPRDAPLIVLSHGGGQTRATWDRTAQYLASRGYGVFAYDLRGHGESGWSAGGQYRLADYVGDLQSIISVIAVGRHVVLAGASLGGIASLIAAPANAECVRALVMIDVTPSVNAKGADRIRNFMEKHRDGFQTIHQASEAVAEFRPRDMIKADLSGLARNLRKDTNGRYYWHWDPKMMDALDSREDREHSMTEACKRLRAPTLLIRGVKSDVMTPIEVDEFKASLPLLEIVDVSEVGHMVVGDKNDAFLRGMSEFLQRTLPPHRTN